MLYRLGEGEPAPLGREKQVNEIGEEESKDEDDRDPRKKYVLLYVVVLGRLKVLMIGAER